MCHFNLDELGCRCHRSSQVHLGLDMKWISRLAMKSSRKTTVNVLYVVIVELSVVVTVFVMVLSARVGAGVETAVSVVTLI